jgi:putative ABC transport system permease protein
MDPELPVFGIQTMESLFYNSVAQPRFRTFLLGNFAALALILAGVGVYGVVSYSVAQRTHEIGVRMALGARQIDIIRMVTGQGMVLALTGVTLGMPGAFVTTRFMSSLLFEVSPTDAVIFVSVAALLSLTTFLACYIPAHRASKADPLTSLRYE